MESYFTELGVTRKMCIHLGILGNEFGWGGGQSLICVTKELWPVSWREMLTVSNLDFSQTRVDLYIETGVSVSQPPVDRHIHL